MQIASFDGLTLEYEISGKGDPVVCIHGSFIATTFRPLLMEPRLLNGYQLITYHRRGYLNSSRPNGVLSIAQQAADCRALLRHLGVDKTHVAGHSFGGVVALQLALDAPELVRTLALLEPALAVGESGPGYRESLANAIRRYHEVGALTVRDFLQARWPDYAAHLDTVLPGAFEQAVTDAETAFESELPGLLEWSFSEAEAKRISQPVLSVLGGKSDALWPRFGETHRTLCGWLPHAESFILPGTTHFLQVENPSAMAEALAAFLARHS